MFKSFWASQEQRAQNRPHKKATNSSTLSRPVTNGPSTSSSFGMTQPTDRPNSLSNVSPAEAAEIVSILEDKSVDELRELLLDEGAYQNLLLSLDPVKTQNKVADELRNGTLQLARENLEKEPHITKLRNQCRIIRTSELDSAQEKLHELERKNEDRLNYYFPSSLLNRLQEAMDKTEDESEVLHRQLLDRELELAAFVQKYKKMRYSYHKRALTQLAMKTSLIS